MAFSRDIYSMSSPSCAEKETTTRESSRQIWPSRVSAPLPDFIFRTTTTTMDDVEVVIRPNFESQDHHEILGCPQWAGEEEIEKAYRDLSREYHPENRPDDDDASGIFIKLGEAYAYLTTENTVDEENQQEVTLKMTSREAKKAYEKKFGKFKKLYYTEGDVLGIPYAYDLRKRLKDSSVLETCSCGPKTSCRIVFFRSWFLKQNLDFALARLEPILTASVMVACFLSFFVGKQYEWTTFTVDQKFDWYIDIVGGVGLLLAFCILNFLYGVARYPLIWQKDAVEVLTGSDSTLKDLDEIRDAVSVAYHGDETRRSQLVAFTLCLPCLVVDQSVASCCVFIAKVLSCTLFTTGDRGNSSALFIPGAAKSTGALLGAIAYYMAWINGDHFVKAAILGVLFVNQSLYGALLCRQGFFEFLFSFVFRGIVSIVIPQHRGKKGGSDKDTDVESKDGSESQKPIDKSTKPQSPASQKTKETEESFIEKDCVPADLQSSRDDTNMEVSLTGDGSTIYRTPGESQEVLESGGSSAVNAAGKTKKLPTHRNPPRVMAIDFTGQIFSANEKGIEVESDDDSVPSVKIQRDSSLVSQVYQLFQKKIDHHFSSADDPVDSQAKEGNAKLETQSPVEEGLSDFPEEKKSNTRSKEKITVISQVVENDEEASESKRKVDKSSEREEGTSLLDQDDSLVSILDQPKMPANEGFIQATTSVMADPDLEMKPPLVRQSSQSSLDIAPGCSILTWSEMAPADIPLLGAKKKASRKEERARKQDLKRESSLVQVPSSVRFIERSRSIDEEELTLVGNFEGGPVASPDFVVGRGRRPAPGKVDLSADAEFLAQAKTLSTDRCDQFFY